MRTAVFVALFIVAGGLWILRLKPIPRLPEATGTSPIGESSPVCPWREPGRDLAALFPGASHYQLETRILSGQMVDIQKRIHRPMSVDENPLRIYRVYKATEALGSILVKRVKGEHGSVELVMGLDTEGSVRGVVMQSQREPAAIALTNWLGHFVGKTAEAALEPGTDLPMIRAEGQATAEAVAEGVRSALVVLSFAETSKVRKPL